MEMETLRSPNHTDTAEPGRSSNSNSYRDAQVWKDIEAETGVASYEEYLLSYEGKRPHFRDWRRRFQHLPREDEYSTEGRKLQIAIYDIAMPEISPTRLRLRCYCVSGTELVQYLRKPPSDVSVQLVLWLDFGSSLSQEMVEAWTLGLKLDLDDISYRKTWSPPRRRIGRQIKSIFGERVTAVISQDFKHDAVPVVLVKVEEGDWWNKLELTLTADSGRIFPSLIFDGRHFIVEKAGQMYARTVEYFIAQVQRCQDSPDSCVHRTKNFLLLAAVSPLLYVQAGHITNTINDVQNVYTEVMFDNRDKFSSPQRTKKDLDTHQLVLRRITEVTEDLLGQLSRYILSESHPDLSTQLSHVTPMTDLTSLVSDARRLDAEIRDCQQIQIGNLALEESRKSIELSNAQIHEAKSVKIFTILAFIYIPLNLATSIFGMNIQQLTGSGQPIWVFFITAAAALIITGGSWLCFNRLAAHKAIAWYKERAAAKKTNKEKVSDREFGLLFRLAMLAWLVRNGHTLWAFESGAWRALLLNDKSFSKQVNPKLGNSCSTVCDYIIQYSSAFSYVNGFKRRPVMVTWNMPLSAFLPRFLRGKTFRRASATDQVNHGAYE